jgi:hypothetical protein
MTKTVDFHKLKEKKIKAFDIQVAITFVLLVIILHSYRKKTIYIRVDIRDKYL